MTTKIKQNLEMSSPSEVIDTATFTKTAKRNKTGVLNIVFTSGATAKYVGVPEVKANGLRRSRSPGGYYNRNIKGQYKHS